MSLLLRDLCVVACVLAVYAKSQGNLNIQSRIVGGSSNAANGAYPYQASLRFQATPASPKSHICGGSVIGALWVLTAGHCVCDEYMNQILYQVGSALPSLGPVINIITGTTCQLLDKSKMFVYLGSISLSGGTEITVQNVIQHPKFDRSKIQYDIALLQLTSATTSTTIALSSVAPVAPRVLTLTGWGLTHASDTTLPDILQTAPLDQIDTASCNQKIKDATGTSYVTDMNVCTLGQSGACSGDSGGPLTDIRSPSGQVVQVGIVSFGISSSNSKCDTAYPSVFTSISFFAASFYRIPIYLVSKSKYCR